MRARDFSHDIYQPVPIAEISAEDRAEVRRWEIMIALQERGERERAARRRERWRAFWRGAADVAGVLVSGLWLLLKAVFALVLVAAMIVEAVRGVVAIAAHLALFGAVFWLTAGPIMAVLVGVRWIKFRRQGR